jgi:hypothetical protein
MMHWGLHNCDKVLVTTFVLVVVSIGVVCTQGALAETLLNVVLEDVDSGTTDPPGPYRWMDVADQLFAETYLGDYDYTQAYVLVEYSTGGATLHGSLAAANLKPNFAYQFKLVGYPETPSNESIGLAGRWWQEEWNGSEWTNGQNLNDKGDGSSPNPNDDVYFARRDIPDPTSPTGKRFRFTGYFVFDYFITDASGGVSLSFEANSSYHVLWKTTQRSHTVQDGLLKATTFAGGSPDPVNAYDVVYPDTTVNVFGEWERLPVGGVTLRPEDYEGQFVLTEESFHGSGLAGGWAAAMSSGPVDIRVSSPSIPTLSSWVTVTVLLILVSLGSLLILRGNPSNDPL